MAWKLRAWERAGILMGASDIYYGYVYNFEEIKKADKEKRRPKLDTTVKERKKLARKKFESCDCVFNSRKEVYAVAELIEKERGDEFLSWRKFKELVKNTLKKIRQN
ncbi:MAG: hypothetical protein Q8Q06_00885 [bacterium]|nr:hypothetical protein [bacterium]